MLYKYVKLHFVFIWTPKETLILVANDRFTDNFFGIAVKRTLANRKMRLYLTKGPTMTIEKHS